MEDQTKIYRPNWSRGFSFIDIMAGGEELTPYRTKGVYLWIDHYKNNETEIMYVGKNGDNMVSRQTQHISNELIGLSELHGDGVFYSFWNQFQSTYDFESLTFDPGYLGTDVSAANDNMLQPEGAIFGAQFATLFKFLIVIRWVEIRFLEGMNDEEKYKNMDSDGYFASFDRNRGRVLLHSDLKRS